MKTISAILLIVFFIENEIISQVVTGKLVDENASGLAEIQLQLYAGQNVYYSTSGLDGSFTFNDVTLVKDEKSPLSYSVSNNYPNPFNPRTRFVITLPSTENVKVEVFNLIGQNVLDKIEQQLNAGTNNIDLELNGLPNGFYISRITIGDKYIAVKKIMLLYGSQHLITSGGTITTQLNRLNNTYFETILDSLVTTSSIIGRKIFTNLPNFAGGTLDLGNLMIERYCPNCDTVVYEGKIYHTVRIGTQCWLKENLDVGTMVQGNQRQTDNGIIEKYCYDNNPSNCDTYGGLYLWDEAVQYSTIVASKGICPTGWHLPSFDEFQILANTVDNNSNKLKAIGQGTGNGLGNNISGFVGLLAGYKLYFDINFYNLNNFSGFWSSSEYDSTDAYSLGLSSIDNIIGLFSTNQDGGYCLRCLKD